MTTRRRALMSQYRFLCCCVACASEGGDIGGERGALNKTDKGLPNSDGKGGVDENGGESGVGGGGEDKGSVGEGRGGGGAEESDPLEEELRYLASTIGDIQAQVVHPTIYRTYLTNLIAVSLNLTCL